MNSKFLILVAVATGVSVATYWSLNTYYPYHKEELKAQESVSVDDVFKGGLQAPEAAEVAVAESAAAEPAAAVAEPSVESTAATTQPDTVAAESAPAAAAPTPTAAPAATAPVEPQAAAASEPAPAAEVPAPAPKAAAKPAPAKMEKPVVKPVPKAAAPAAPATPKFVAPAKPAVAAAPLEKWWGGNEDGNNLSLVYAASAAYKKSIVLMFNGVFDSADSANKNLQVFDSKNKPAAGNWQVAANNKHMLLFTVNDVGRYTVVIKAGLKDHDGRAVPSEVRGPVLVQ